MSFNRVAPSPIKRRSLTPYTGTRVQRSYYFVADIGNKWPDESAELSNSKPVYVDRTFRNWKWMLQWLQANPSHWLVIPLKDKNMEIEYRDLANLRAAIWRRGIAMGIALTSAHWDHRLWVHVV